MLVSDLDLPGQQLARALIINQLFERYFEISAREINGREWEDPGTVGLGLAWESYIYNETPYCITLENSSDLSIDNLIVEYQVFFKQTLAGTPESSNEQWRFVGYSIVKAIPAKDKYTITVNPPAIKESRIHGYSGSTREFTLRYPKGRNQKSSGCMQGIWIRVHRTTPYGCLTREIKNGIIPDGAEWASK